MSPSTTTTRFDEEAFAALPPTAPFVEAIRKQAFEELAALPLPSQETEEWRYTDLEEFDFDLRPFTDGGGPEGVNAHGVLAAAKVVGERAGMQIQRNSEIISTQLADGLAGNAASGSGTWTARRSSGRTSSSPTCTGSWRPTDPSSRRCTRRSARAGRSCSSRGTSGSSCRSRP